MNTQAPAFQFYPQDFLVGTAIFTAEQAGAYIRFLCYQWEHGALPDDIETLARLGGCHGNAVASVRAKFDVGADGLLRNARLEQIRNEQKAFRDRQSQNAKNGWEKRNKKTDTDATASKRQRGGKKAAHAKPDATAMPNACQNDALHSSNNTPIVPTGDGADSGNLPWDEDAECCARIWEAYDIFPRGRERSSKPRVRKAWDAIPKSERPEHDELVDSLGLWRKSEKWTKAGGQYVCTAHVWVKDRKWGITPVPAPTATGGEDSLLGRTLKTSEFRV
ncbi:DUF1376 domain-containing protein [Luteolibacter soli]|uniref:DUF1376 domain-containing protein n=1 Tax=Luteolibacter soli TaxID=3135280 RepID=A0ABU9B0R2_9BACT